MSPNFDPQPQLETNSPVPHGLVSHWLSGIMKNKIHPRLIQYGIAISFLLLATMSHAVTTLVSLSRYSITEGVAFTIGNSGSSDFLLNWTDPTGAPPLSFASIADPTLVLTLGQTYTFQRTSTAHPFAIMDNSAATFITGTDGNYSRTTTNSTLINDATLFTANPGTPGDILSWTPDALGDFWYTCSVTSHTGMTGLITIVPEPSAIGLIALGIAFVALRLRRGSMQASDNTNASKLVDVGVNDVSQPSRTT